MKKIILFVTFLFLFTFNSFALEIKPFGIELGKKLEVELLEPWVPGFNLIDPPIKNSNFDVILAAMSITDERQMQIDFSIPYFAPTEGGYVGIGIRKNDNDLKSKINNAISDAVNEGIIKKISMQWFQEDFTP